MNTNLHRIALLCILLCAICSASAQPEAQLSEDRSESSIHAPGVVPSPSCETYRLTMVRSGKDGVAPNFDSRSELGKNLSCLEAILQEKYNGCQAAKWTFRPGQNGWDDCIAEHIAKRLKFGRKPTGLMYFNASCTPVAPAATPKELVCDAGTIFYWHSPISLLWDGRQQLSGEATVVTFPLDPSRESRYFVWKASEKTPLLVYDPEHSGKITSATQLFGHWAMGGRKLAAVQNTTSDATPSEISTQWNNGFEALATLDSNGDGEVSGSELRDLGLWFDRNRNGISEEGEVQSLERAGVLSLYYRVDRESTTTPDLYVTRGFKRIVEGSIVYGTAVDWFAESDHSKTELLQKLIARNSLLAQSAEAGELSIPAQKPTPAALVSGLWRWKPVVEKNDNRPAFGGLFHLTASAKGTLKGLSIAEAALPPEHPFNSAASFRVLEGRVYSRQAGAGEVQLLEFNFVTEDGSELRNQAELSADGSRLIGRTNARIRNGEVWVRIDYQWEASRAREPLDNSTGENGQ